MLSSQPLVLFLFALGPQHFFPKALMIQGSQKIFGFHSKRKLKRQAILCTELKTANEARKIILEMMANNNGRQTRERVSDHVHIKMGHLFYPPPSISKHQGSYSCSPAVSFSPLS